MIVYLQKYAVLILVLTARYFIVAGSYFALTQRIFKQRTRTSIVNSAALFKDQIKFEIKQSLITVFIFALGGVNFAYAKQSESSQIYYDIAEYGWLYFIFSIVLMVAINDVYFYWLHRTLHRRPFFGRFHSIHHRSRVTTPWTSHSFHWVENVGNILIVFTFPYLFPTHPTAYIIFTFIAFFNNIYGHGNYDFVPHRWQTKPPFQWLNSPTIHSFHHKNRVGNYGLYTNFWDRLHGTYIDPEKNMN